MSARRQDDEIRQDKKRAARTLRQAGRNQRRGAAHVAKQAAEQPQGATHRMLSARLLEHLHPGPFPHATWGSVHALVRPCQRCACTHACADQRARTHTHTRTRSASLSSPFSSSTTFSSPYLFTGNGGAEGEGAHTTSLVHSPFPALVSPQCPTAPPCLLIPSPFSLPPPPDTDGCAARPPPAPPPSPRPAVPPHVFFFLTLTAAPRVPRLPPLPFSLPHPLFFCR